MQRIDVYPTHRHAVEEGGDFLMRAGRPYRANHFTGNQGCLVDSIDQRGHLVRRDGLDYWAIIMILSFHSRYAMQSTWK